jgi:hypothetical protein
MGWLSVENCSYSYGQKLSVFPVKILVFYVFLMMFSEICGPKEDNNEAGS